MAAKAKYLDQLADMIAALRAQRRVEIQAEIDALRDMRVAQMQAEVNALRDQYRAFIDDAEARP